LRLGVRRSPAHGSRWRDAGDKDRGPFPPGEAELHVAAGLEVAFKRVQLGLRVDEVETARPFLGGRRDGGGRAAVGDREGG